MTTVLWLPRSSHTWNGTTVASRTRKLEVVLAGDAKGAARAFDQVERKADGFGGKMSKVGGVVAGAFKAAGVATAAAAGAASVAIFKIGTDYEDSLNLFQSVSQATAGEMERVREQAKRLGNDLTLPGTSAGNAARAMTELAKAGLSVNETLAASKGVLQLASAAQVDEATAAQITANALNAFSLAGTEANRVADLLAGAANASSGEITDMADALQMSSAVFASAGVPIEDLTSAIGLMANKGIMGSDAGTSLKTMMLSLMAPSKKAAAGLADLGISVYDAEGRMRPMRDLIGQFSEKLAPLEQEQRNVALATIFGTDAIRAANIVMAGGVEAFDAMNTAVTREGAAADLAAAKNKGLRGALDGLKSQFETIAIEIYESVGPALNELVRWVAERVPSAFETIKTAVGTAFRAIRQWWDENGPAVVEGFSTFRDRAVEVFTRVSEIVSMVVTSIRAWFAENRTTLEEWRAKLASIFTNVWAVISGFIDLVKVAWGLFGQTILDSAARTFSAILAVIDGALRVVKGIIDFFIGVFTGDWSRAWEGIKGIVSGAWEAIKGVFSLAFERVRLIASLAWEGIKAIFGNAFTSLKDTVHIALLTIKLKFLEWAGGIVDAAATAFGWVPGIGPKLREARDRIREFREETNREIAHIKDKKITITVARIINEHVNRPRAGDGPGGPVPGRGGRALARVQSIIGAYPGLRITNTYRTPEHNRRVGGSPTSYHLDKVNPAVDIGGPTWQLDRIAAAFRAAGGWRELLWRTKGHYDHVHVAHQGGFVTPRGIAPLRSDELLTKLQVGETVIPVGGVRGHDGASSGDTHIHYHIGTFVGSDERAFVELEKRVRRKGYVRA